MTLEILNKELEHAEAKKSEAEKEIKQLRGLIAAEQQKELDRKGAVKVLMKLDKKIWMHFYPDWVPHADYKPIEESYTYLYFESDVRSIICDFDFEEAKAYICNQIHENATAGEEEIINEHLHWDSYQKEAAIRNDFAAAFRGVNNGAELSGALYYSFSEKDIQELAKLHKANRFRKKIEDLLTNCNYHSECGLMAKKEYDKL